MNTVGKSILRTAFICWMLCLSTTVSMAITLNVKNQKIRQVIHLLEQREGYSFFYNEGLSELDNHVSIRTTNSSIEETLEKLFSNTRITFHLKEGKQVVLSDKRLSASVTETKQTRQEENKRKITGSVRDESGEGLAGVNIVIQGTATGTVSDLDGNFTLSVSENTILEISYIGFLSQNIQIANQTHLDLVLREDTKLLNEVVVLGYGANARKQDLSASVGIISNADQLVVRPVTSTESMIQGQLAGVTVSLDSGDPTSTPSVVVRGQGSQKGDNVLWVVDGIPGAPIASMNDIESIVVLKDAASAAIYGAQSGAGGVILVTTRKARKGEPTLSYDGIFGMRQATNLPQSLTAEQEIEVRRTSYANAGMSLPTGWDTTVNPWIGTTRTDWIDAIFRTALYQRHNVALNVGTDTFKHRLSFAYDNDEGTLINTFNKATTMRYNSSIQLNKWVTISEDFVWKNTSGRGTDTSSGYSGVILSALYMPRSATVYNPLDGSYGGTTTEDPEYIARYGNFASIHGDAINPVRLLEADTNYDKTSDLWSSTSLEIANITPGLKFTSRFTYNLKSNHYKNFTPIRDEVGKPDMSNSLNESTYRADAWKTENTLTYDRTLGEHTFGALLSTTADRYERRELNVSGSGFADESEYMQYLAYANSTTAQDYLKGPDANVSLISRLAYSFNDRYFLTASYRRDYAGRLPKENNYGDFPAVTAAWKLSNEAFFPKSDFLTLLKLRASWGRVGNLGSINDNYKSSILSKSENTSNESGQYGVTAGKKWGTAIYNNTAFNPDLTWETSEQTDIGLDLDMFRGRFSLALDYFDKRTFNLIQTATMDWPGTIGLDPMYVNQGEVRNRGFEVQGGWTDQLNRNLSYFVSGNFAYLKNWVSDIGVKNTDGTPGVWTGNGSFRNLSYMYQTAQGEPLNSYYLIKTDGIFQSDAEAAAYVDETGERIQPNAVAGDLKFVDYNGDGVINDKDRQYLGSATPKTTFALNLGFTYKKLSVSALFQGVGGSQSLNIAKYMTLSDLEGDFNRSNEILNAWSQTNTSSSIPRLSKSDPNGNFTNSSDWYLEDASYLRFKNFTISYDMTNLLRKWNYLNERNSVMSVYLSGENLYTFTNYSGIDPENGGWDALKYPVSRVLSVGVKLTY